MRVFQFERRSGNPPEYGPRYRQQYLLRPEIALPLTVSRSVWPEAPDGDEIALAAAPGAIPWGVDEDVEPAWNLLGYDVADDGLTSGLANCGYDAAQLPALRAKWAPRLNEYGLFAELSDAEEFRVFSDDRVPEHRPFLVIAIYLRCCSKNSRLKLKKR